MKNFAIIDIETTGGNYSREKITEIAVIIHDGKSILNQYSSLVNPERSIPPFISRLTGITDQMVAGAPKFFEIAKEIVELTNDCYFVAHNVNFDYSFLKREFSDLGFKYHRQRLCTCKLSRRAFNGLASYGLGNLCKELRIENKGRHRALGDARATSVLFEMIFEKLGAELIHNFLSSGDEVVYLPPQIKPSFYHSLPESTGVYYFRDENDEVIYVGKSSNIKKRVGQHFRVKNPVKQKKLLSEVHFIDYEITGSELVALLLENKQIKQILPKYNRAKKRRDFKFGIYDSLNAEGYLTFKISKMASGIKPLTSFSSRVEAESLLSETIKAFRLCSKLCGVSNASRNCFENQIGLCYGACSGKELVVDYNGRAEAAMRSLMLENDNMLIVDRGRSYTERSIIQVENGALKGYGFFSGDMTFSDIDALKEVISEVDSDPDPDSSKIISSALRRQTFEKLISY